MCAIAHRWRSQYNFMELIGSIYCHVASRGWTGVLRFFIKRVSLLSHLSPSPWLYTGVDYMSHTNTHPPENNFLLYRHRLSPLFFRIGDQVVMLCKSPSYLPRFIQPLARSNGTTGEMEKVLHSLSLGISFTNPHLTMTWLVPLVISSHWSAVIHFFFLQNIYNLQVVILTTPDFSSGALHMLAMLCSHQGYLSMGSVNLSTWNSMAMKRDSYPLLSTSLS